MYQEEGVIIEEVDWIGFISTYQNTLMILEQISQAKAVGIMIKFRKGPATIQEMYTQYGVTVEVSEP